MSDLTPITREEALLDGADLEPITRKEQFIKRIYDKTQEVPEPITREEWFLKKAGEGGGGVTVEQLNATENGTYSEQGKAYSPVIVEVPEPTLITKSITANGTYSASDDNADGYSQVTVAVEGFKKKFISNTPTDIASFNDGTANPMPSLEISINPVQSGSGDPSPSNVRPISGWSGANIQQWKKNCTVGVLEDCYIGSNGRFTDDSSYSMQIAFVKKGITYAITTDEALNKFVGGFFTNYPTKLSTSYNGERVIGESNIFTAPIDGYAVFRTSKGYNTPQCEVGDEATTYSPYQGSTLSIPFHDSSDNPVTVYGGTLNVTSGELRVTHGYVDLGTLSWTYQPAGTRFTANLNGVKKSASTSSRANIICSKYITGTPNDTWDTLDNVIAVSNTGEVIFVRDTAYTDTTAFKTAMNGVQLVYELATPQTYQLAPTQVATLLNQNNIFADCGQILEGEYFVAL